MYLKARNKTVVCLNFTYPLKIDKIYAKMSSDRIPQEYSPGLDRDQTVARPQPHIMHQGIYDCGQSTTSHWGVGLDRSVRLRSADNLIRKAFQFKKLLAMKFTTQHHFYQ